MTTTTHRPCPITGMTVHTHKAAREMRAKGRVLTACTSGGRMHYHVELVTR